MLKKCLRCNYEWETRKSLPKACPECKSRKWHIELTNKNITPIVTKVLQQESNSIKLILNCKRCSFSWLSRKPIVRACPRCKSYLWNVEPTSRIAKIENIVVEVMPDWEAIELAHMFKTKDEITWVVLRFSDGTLQKRPDIMKTMPIDLYSKWFEKWKLAGGR